MGHIKLIARGKINLSLDVLAKRPDNYHELKMIMQTIDIYDTVTLESLKRGGIEVSCNSKWVPCGPRNIAYKAAELLINRYKISSGVRIIINKKIPVAAGLAGGSSDAAAVLKGMNLLFSLGLSESVLMSLGKEIGADVPYCIRGGTMLAEGIGEILTPLKPLGRIDIVLIKPRIAISTAWVYKNLNLNEITDRPDTGMLIKAISDNNIDVLAKNMRNVLETVSIKRHDIIRAAKERLLELGALGSMMSGSGPTVFGIFRDKQSAERAYNAVKDGMWECYLTQTACEES
jgi:4-diphosphocytidyl-2-C-methyl-D-erythritol kinase